MLAMGRVAINDAKLGIDDSTSAGFAGESLEKTAESALHRDEQPDEAHE
jgi:hypothetical protein